MTTEQNPYQIVFTNKARCRDCYRCVRVCPVKAIRMRDGQAFVVEDRCISCGTCVRECPQKAKSYRKDIETAIGLIEAGKTVAVSIAPSFAAFYNDWERRRLASALRKLGFGFVAETAVGAYYVAQETAKIIANNSGRAYIGTACPTVVSYIEKYQPEAIQNLVPVVSPMLAHAKEIKAKLGEDARVVFIGPCVAKKAEAQRAELAGCVDCVLTFAELDEWLSRRGIVLASCEESDFDEVPKGTARFFPLAGGELKTGNFTTDMLAQEVISVSGYEDVREAIESCTAGSKGIFIEPLFCCQGCINGPAIVEANNTYQRRKDIIDFAGRQKNKPENADAVIELVAVFAAKTIEGDIIISEEQIRTELEKTGKAKPEDQLNCGACGYHNCREKAVAVIKGLAEQEMCIPHMRRLAEQRTDRIIETSPNGIVILDDKLNVLSMNPAFTKFFLCSEAVCGKRISYLMDPEPFEKLACGETKILEDVVRHEKYHLLCHQIMYALEQEKQYVGIFVNITNSQSNQEKLDQLRSQTIMQARELFEHQLGMAQRIAQFLGESTAKGEKLVENLMQLASDESKKTPEKKNTRPWDMYTSK